MFNSHWTLSLGETVGPCLFSSLLVFSEDRVVLENRGLLPCLLSLTTGSWLLLLTQSMPSQSWGCTVMLQPLTNSDKMGRLAYGKRYTFMSSRYMHVDITIILDNFTRRKKNPLCSQNLALCCLHMSAKLFKTTVCLISRLQTSSENCGILGC